MLITVKYFNDDDKKVTSFENFLQKDKRYIYGLKEYHYQTDDDIKMGDIVLVPVSFHESEYLKWALVTGIDTKTNYADLPYEVKYVYAKLTLSQHVNMRIKAKKQAALWQRIEQRAQLLKKIHELKKLAKHDQQLAKMLTELDPDNMDIDTLLMSLQENNNS